jgi:hypothetical protein
MDHFLSQSKPVQIPFYQIKVSIVIPPKVFLTEVSFLQVFYLKFLFRSLNAILVKLKKKSLGVNITIELKNITATSESTGTLHSQNIHRQMPLLYVVVTFLGSIVVSTPNGQFLDCATKAFSERFQSYNTSYRITD